MSNGERYWFPAKRYGWGWGLPITWQGWLVFLGYALLIVLGLWIFPPRDDTFSFIGYVCASTVLLFIICYAKGEPPSWRWGDKR